MKKAKKMLRIWLILILFCTVSAIAGTAVLALLALKGIYIPMAIVIPLTAHGYWGFGFYVRAFYRARLYGRLACLVCELGTESPELLSPHVGLTPSATAVATERAKEKGYL